MKKSLLKLLCVTCCVIGLHGTVAAEVFLEPVHQAALPTIDASHERENTNVAWYDNVCRKFGKGERRFHRFTDVEEMQNENRRMTFATSHPIFFSKKAKVYNRSAYQKNQGLFPNIGMAYQLPGNSFSLTGGMRKTELQEETVDWLSTVGLSVDIGSGVVMDYALEIDPDLGADPQHMLSFTVNFDS